MDMPTVSSPPQSPPEQSGQQPAEPRIDEMKMNRLLQEIRDNQSLGVGMLGGLGGALIGSIAWATVTYLTEYHIGIMAIAVGWLVGLGVSRFGRGIGASFAAVGALAALFGCVLGNLLTACIYMANAEGMGFFEILSELTPLMALGIMVMTFSPMDVLFYGIAIWTGYKYSERRLTEAELASVTRRA